MILLVDDEFDRLEPLEDFAEVRGYSVARAKSLAEASTAIDVHGSSITAAVIDAILSPEAESDERFGGVAVVSMLRRKRPDLALVVWTAGNTTEVRRRVEGLGIREVRSKIDTSLTELLDSLEESQE